MTGTGIAAHYSLCQADSNLIAGVIAPAMLAAACWR